MLGAVVRPGADGWIDARQPNESVLVALVELRVERVRPASLGRLSIGPLDDLVDVGST